MQIQNRTLLSLSACLVIALATLLSGCNKKTDNQDQNKPSEAQAPADPSSVLVERLEVKADGQVHSRHLLSDEIIETKSTESTELHLVRIFLYPDHRVAVEINRRQINGGLDSGYLGLVKKSTWEVEGNSIRILDVGILMIGSLTNGGLLIFDESFELAKGLPVSTRDSGIIVTMKNEWLPYDIDLK